MPHQSVDISGLAENEALITALGAGLAEKMRQIALTCAEREAARIEAVTPVDTGNLKRNWVVDELPDGAQIRDDVPYGTYQWKGTRRMAPNVAFAAELDAAGEHIMADATRLVADLLRP